MKAIPGLRLAQLSLIFSVACMILLASWLDHSGAWYADTSIRPKLPPETPFNDGVGLLGEDLSITLHSDLGEDWLFNVDTGSPVTILDKSLESKLGARRETKEVSYGWTGKTTVGIYAAPKLFLGETQLLTGQQVWTDDLGRFSQRPIKGILGMDCLHYYCLQLDFAARKLRFLDPDRLNPKDLGEPFPLFIGTCSTMTRADFMGVKNAAIGVDTGAWNDGSLGTKLFQQTFKNQSGTWVRLLDLSAGTKSVAHFREGRIGAGVYSDLILAQYSEEENCVGLRFLARHLVTFAFPKRTMYLQRQSVEPRADNTTTFIESFGDGDDDPMMETGERFYRYLRQQPGGDLTLEALEFVKNLAMKKQLPGFPEITDDNHGAIGIEPLALREADSATYPAYRTFCGHWNGEQSKCHYVVFRASENSVWKLQKAWRTGSGGRLMEEYPVP